MLYDWIRIIHPVLEKGSHRAYYYSFDDILSAVFLHTTLRLSEIAIKIFLKYVVRSHRYI